MLFIPQGYERLEEARERLGADKLGRALASGDVKAFVVAHQGQMKAVDPSIWRTHDAKLLIDTGKTIGHFNRQTRIRHDGDEIIVSSPPSVAAVSENTPVKNRGGRPRYYWEAFYIEIIRLANSPDGLPDKQSDLERIMLEWCERHWGDAAESTVRGKISPVYRALARRPET